MVHKVKVIYKIFSVNLYKALSIERPSIDPNGSSARILRYHFTFYTQISQLSIMKQMCNDARFFTIFIRRFHFEYLRHSEVVPLATI
jgi:hypothetical protein